MAIPPLKESEDKGGDSFNFREFCNRFIPPKPFDLVELMESSSNEFQVAGHSGFLTNRPAQCLKPINPKCVRSRREHLFYQMAKHFKHCTDPGSVKLYYKDFKLLRHPDKECHCQINPDTFKSINMNIPDFLAVKHLTLQDDDFATNEEKQKAFLDELYNDGVWCPCYGNDRQAKNKCSADYNQENFICMEDLHAHCKTPCVLDIKVGRTTYDPMANEAKVQEQSTKYPRVRDFGFRVLGMHTGLINRDKSYGKSLDNQEQVFEAIESFFESLYHMDRKVVVIGKMLDRLERILEWFETMNNNQIRFYSSSLLFIYDSGIRKNEEENNEETLKRLGQSVRVGMIDFAHVFHSHDPPEGPSRSGSGTSIFTSGNLNKDDNYLYGLRRLVKFFIMLNRQHRIRLRSEQQVQQQ